jgi:hypothetical protein
MAGPQDQNLFEVIMDTQDLFVNLMEELDEKKPEERGPLARYYAILLTELEKMYAFYMLYIYPTEENEDE